MTLETQVQALTTATEQLLQAVNTRKFDLDTAEAAASASATAAQQAKTDAQAADDLPGRRRADYDAWQSRGRRATGRKCRVHDDARASASVVRCG